MFVFFFFDFILSGNFPIIEMGFKEFYIKKNEKLVLQIKNDYYSNFVNFYSKSDLLYSMIISDADKTYVSYVNDSSKQAFFVEGELITILPKCDLYIGMWTLGKDICENTGIFVHTHEVLRMNLEITTHSSKNHHDPICFFTPPFYNNEFIFTSVPASKGDVYEAAEFGKKVGYSFSGSISKKTTSQSFITFQPTETSPHVEVTLQYTGNKINGKKVKIPTNKCEAVVLENISPYSKEFGISLPGGTPSDVQCGEAVKDAHTPVIFIIVITAAIFIVVILVLTAILYLIQRKHRDDEGYLIEKQDDSLELSKIVDTASDRTVSSVNLADIPKFI